MGPVDVAIALQLEGDSTVPGGGALRGFSLSEFDIEPYAAQEWTLTATDGWISLPEDGLTHTRVYGSFPRKIGVYARERGVLTVAAAVRSATSLPASVMGFHDRGMIREGYVADLVVLDLESLADNATFFEPHQYPSGIESVLIGGQFAVDGGRPTGALIGRVLTRNEPAR
jgi:N-acyl-D-aspartate/D-glutamate deacylase